MKKIKLLSLIAAISLFGSAAMAAAVCGPTTACKGEPVTLTSTNGTTAVSAYTVTGTQGAKLLGIFVTSNVNANPPLVQLSVKRGSNTTILYDCPMPATTFGNTQNPAINIFQQCVFNGSNTFPILPSIPLDENGQPYISFSSGDVIQVGVVSSLASGGIYTFDFQLQQF